mgnify:CR=1 FL=1
MTAIGCARALIRRSSEPQCSCSPSSVFALIFAVALGKASPCCSLYSCSWFCRMGLDPRASCGATIVVGGQCSCSMRLGCLDSLTTFGGLFLHPEELVTYCACVRASCYDICDTLMSHVPTVGWCHTPSDCLVGCFFCVYSHRRISVCDLWQPVISLCHVFRHYVKLSCGSSVVAAHQPGWYRIACVAVWGGRLCLVHESKHLETYLGCYVIIQ